MDTHKQSDEGCFKWRWFPRRRLPRVVLAGCLLLAGATALFGISLVMGSFYAQWSRPVLRLSTHELDLGKGKPGEEMRGTFEIRNVGRKPLDFRISASCGCTALAPHEGTLGPGERREVLLAFKLSGYSDSDRSVGVVVESRAAGSSDSCRVVARCPAPVTVTPAFVSVGPFVSEVISSAEECLVVQSSAGATPVDLGRLQVQYNSKHLRITKERVSDEKLRLRLKLSANLPPGELYETIVLRPPGSTDAVCVPVRVQVVEPLSVVPATVFLRSDAQTRESLPIELLLVSRQPGVHLGRVRLVDGPPGFVIERDTGLSPTLRKVRLRAAADRQEGEPGNERRIELGAEGVGDTCVVALVREGS